MLELLDVSNNCLRKITPELGYCDRLTHLFLSNNLLTELPATLSRILMNPKSQIILSGNKVLQIPQEIISDTASLREYLVKLPLGNDVRWNKVKLVILGTTAVGKTTLCQHLAGTRKGSKPLSTDGVNISPFSIHNVEFNAYDFGNS